jgi:COMPASS component SWD2
MAQQEPQELLLNDATVETLVMAKLFKDNHPSKINALDFSQDGELLVTSGDDENVNLYNCLTGKKVSNIPSKKYGVDLVRFTRDKETIICASKNGWNESLRYLQLKNKSYLRYFQGHRYDFAIEEEFFFFLFFLFPFFFFL